MTKINQDWYQTRDWLNATSGSSNLGSPGFTQGRYINIDWLSWLELFYLFRGNITRILFLTQYLSDFIRTQWVTGIYKFKPPTLTPEQESALMHVATRLCEGITDTRRHLAQATGMSLPCVQMFQCAHRDQFPHVAPIHQHQERLEHEAEVHAKLEAQGKRIAAKRPARVPMRVRNEPVLEFLRAHRGESHATEQAR